MKAGRSHFDLTLGSLPQLSMMIITGIYILFLFSLDVCLEFVVVDHVPSRLNITMTMHR